MVKTKDKACKVCKVIYEGDRCPKCESKEFTDSYKGKIYILDCEKSEIAKKINLNSNGKFAIKTR